MNINEYKVVSLAKILDYEDGENIFHDIVRDFSCPQNEDVEQFLKSSAVNNQRMNLSRTNLVFLPQGKNQLLVGYYSLALQVLDLNPVFSKSLRKKITGFKQENKSGAAVYLLGQLGKNFNCGANKNISGHDLFLLAIRDIIEASRYVGGRIVLIECKDDSNLRNFYGDKLGLQLIDEASNNNLLKYITLVNAYTVQS